MHFADADHGWLLGRVATGAAMSVGELLATADGGESWQRLPPPPVAGRFIFVSAERGFMTGAPVSERLYRTLDGGRSWHELRFPIARGPGPCALRPAGVQPRRRTERWPSPWAATGRGFSAS